VRRGKVLFVDASARYQSGKNQNIMSASDIAVIDAAYKHGEDTDGDDGLNLRLVDIDELEGNGFDLNITLYIKSELVAEANVEGALTAYREARERLNAADVVLAEKLKAAGFGA